MKQPSRALNYFAGIASIAMLLAWLGAPLIPESSPAARGAKNARIRACIDCHGQPGSRLRDVSKNECDEKITPETHPTYRGRCADILAYFETVRLKRNFLDRANTVEPNELLRGEILARQYNCFNCHGELGQGGLRNTGALKGYIPGYFGNDFSQLTQGNRKESIQAWISHGVDADLFKPSIKGRIARYFINRQEISMPRFDTIPQSEIQQLTNYVHALHEFGGMDAESIRMYSDQTMGL